MGQTNQTYRPCVLVSAILIGMLLVITSCKSDPTGADKERGGLGIVVPGESAEGIKLGYSREQVKEILGDPESMSIGSGLGAWLFFHYGNGVDIAFKKVGDTNQWGYADMISVQSPYEGSTPEGLSIGDSSEKITELYGTPVRFSTREDEPQNVNKYYYYCYGSDQFRIKVFNDTVDTFHMGYFYPSELASFPCNEDE